MLVICTTSANSPNSLTQWVKHAIRDCFNVDSFLTWHFPVLLRGPQKVQSSLILTRCPPWYHAPLCLAWSPFCSWRPCLLFWTPQCLCSHCHVLLLHDVSHGTPIPKVPVVETAPDNASNDPICGYHDTWVSTSLLRRLWLSVAIFLLHWCSCCFILRSILPVLHCQLPQEESFFCFCSHQGNYA